MGGHSFFTPFKPQSHIHDFGPGRATVHPDLASRKNRGESGLKRKKSSINTVSHDAPTVSARFVYGSTTTHAGSATIHPDGATNAEECSRCGHDSIRCYYGLSGSATAASRSPTYVHDLAVFM